MDHCTSIVCALAEPTSAEPPCSEGVPSGVMQAQEAAIRAEALSALTEAIDESLFALSFNNCHFKGITSLWLTPTLRAFIAYDRIDGVCDESDTGFLVHNHRYPITSVPVLGDQVNVLYTLASADDDAGADYTHFKFESGLFRPDRTPQVSAVGTVRLIKRIAHTNVAWRMETNEIHRVVWPSAVTIALIKEHRSLNEINTRATDAYLVTSATCMPCEDGLYTPLKAEEHAAARTFLLRHITSLHTCATT